MNETKILNKVRTLLGMEVALESMKLEDGVTIIEAEVFEAGEPVRCSYMSKTIPISHRFGWEYLEDNNSFSKDGQYINLLNCDTKEL